MTNLESKYTTFYMSIIVIFTLSVIVFEIFAIECQYSVKMDPPQIRTEITRL